MVTEIGNPDRGIIIAGYIGALLLGSSYIAIGLWVSSITKNQIISFDQLPNSIAFIGKFLSFSTHFNSILRGVISLADIVYYLSIVIFFLFLNARVVGMKKWK
jgi:ABC-2 type transport system permease protein